MKKLLMKLKQFSNNHFFLFLITLFSILSIQKIETYNSNGVKRIYLSVFGYTFFIYEKSESLIVIKLFGYVIYSKELDNFNEEDFFKDLKEEYYYGND